MSVEQNKATAIEFFTRLSDGNIESALELMTDDVTWLLPGKPAHFPTAGLYDKKRLARLFQVMFSQLENGLKMTITSSIGEGDVVALEGESYGELTNGRVYNQLYHFHMEFQDSKIHTVREYLDTQHAFAVWLAQPEQTN